MSFQLDYYEASAIIAHGELKPEDLPNFRKAIKQFVDGRYTIKIEKFRRHRTHAQNRFWHGIVVKAFADHCGYEFDEMKDVLALKLIPKDIVDITTGEVHTVPGHTSQLTAKEFNELIERAQRLGAEMEIYIPDPREVSA